MPANPYESAEQSRLQDVPKLELPKVKPAEEKPAEPLKVAQLKDKPGEAKISRAQRIHEQSEILRAVMEGEAPTGEYHREKPENRPRGEEKPPEMYDRMSRLGSIGGRRPDVEEQKKKENKPKEGGEETTL